MCLIAMAWGMHPDYPLVIAANRDEWYARPTAPLTQWRTGDDAAHGSGYTILSGRDLQSGGTWMGFTPQGRFAMLTNIRKGSANTARTENSAATPLAKPPSRGELVVNWLSSSATAQSWTAQQTPAAYEGFNLILGDWASQTCHYVTNQALHPIYPSNTPVVQVSINQTAIEYVAGATQALSAGSVFGLSNAALNTPWPKTLALCAAVRSALEQLEGAQLDLAQLDGTQLSRKETDVQARVQSEDGLLQRLQLALQDSTVAADHILPQTGVPIDLERDLSSVFVRHPRDSEAATYGTRSSLCVLLHRDGRLRLQETTHNHPEDAAPSMVRQGLQWPTARPAA
jgi:uncharacterized protein with NRDE domain